MLLRYEPLHSGLQAACPKQVFTVLEERLGVNTEAFASPLNCRLDNFHSAFPEDEAFGSLGSFFEASPTQGSFEVNPPFTEATIARAYHHIAALLTASTEAPLQFVVVIPRWASKACWQLFEGSSWTRRSHRLKCGYHRFAVGALSAENGKFIMATNDTSLFFMQNEAAAEKWPVEDETIDLLERAFGVPEQNLSSRPTKRRKQDEKKKQTKKEKKKKTTTPGSNWQMLKKDMTGKKRKHK